MDAWIIEGLGITNYVLKGGAYLRFVSAVQSYNFIVYAAGRSIYILHLKHRIVHIMKGKYYEAELTVLKERIAKRFAIMVLNPGARQDCAMKPSLSSARQMTSSPCFQSQLGMLSR